MRVDRFLINPESTGYRGSDGSRLNSKSRKQDLSIGIPIHHRENASVHSIDTFNDIRSFNSIFVTSPFNLSIRVNYFRVLFNGTFF